MVGDEGKTDLVSLGGGMSFIVCCWQHLSHICLSNGAYSRYDREQIKVQETVGCNKNVFSLNIFEMVYKTDIYMHIRFLSRLLEE